MALRLASTNALDSTRPSRHLLQSFQAWHSFFKELVIFSRTRTGSDPDADKALDGAERAIVEGETRFTTYALLHLRQNAGGGSHGRLGRACCEGHSEKEPVQFRMVVEDRRTRWIQTPTSTFPDCARGDAKCS